MEQKETVSKTAKVTLIITVIAVVSKALGFLRDAILAHYYGSSVISDVFITTLSLPDILFELISNSITIGFVPIATSILHRRNNVEDINRFASNVISIFEILALLFTGVFCIFARQIISIAAPGFKGECVDIAVLFLRIISVSMIFKTASSIFGAYMHTNKNFIPVSMYGAIMDIVIIGFIIISVKRWYVFLPYGVLIGVLVQMIFASVCATSTGFRYRAVVNFSDPDLRAMLSMFVPAIAATGANQIIQLVNKGLATTVVEGGVTLISNANKMGYAAENIIVLSIAAVLYPTLSTYAAQNNNERFKEELSKGLKNTLILMVPMTVALIIYAHPIIQILFGHGKYVNSVAYTSMLMQIYCCGIIGLSSYTIMVRALYANKMVFQSALCAVISLVINVCLSVLLTKKMSLGLIGISVSTSVTHTISFILSLFILSRRIGSFGSREVTKTIIKTIIACIPMGILSLLTFRLCVGINTVFALAICALVGVIVYFGCMYLLKVDEVKDILTQLQKKLSR